MIYTKLTKKALLISVNAHKDQHDKSGMPYVYHPYEVASRMNDEYSTCTALLHDVVEDTDITLDDLSKEGFPREIIEALSCMTHDKSVPYDEYIKMIKTNPIATKVKLADLEHNSNPDRLDNIDEKMQQRFEKYNKARAYLLSE